MTDVMQVEDADDGLVVDGDVGEDARQDEVLRLAAVRAAIDPERRYVRADILVSAIVEVLARGPLTETELRAAVNRSWATGAVSKVMLRRALDVAAHSFLVCRQVQPAGEDTWALREGVREEAERDGEWARSALADFEATLGQRLEDITGNVETPELLSRLTRHLLSGLAAAVEGTYRTAADSAAPGHLRPLRVDGKAVLQYMRQARIYDGVSSSRRGELSWALEQVVAAVLDPTDGFGNELLRLLTIGNILQGLLSARDVAGQRVLEGTRALLDTSTLIHVAESGTSGRAVFDELVSLSQAAGVELVVALHTLEEYERLWTAADAEIDGFTASQLERLSATHALVKNPFVREFLRLREADERLSWRKFQVGRRQIRPVLEAAGIKVCWHGNESQRCRQLAGDVEEKLTALSADPGFEASRSPQAAADDAQSCAMVARWRRERPADPPTGWFIAPETLTGRAYEQLTNDDYLLTASPEGWLLYLSNLGAGDGDSTRSLAVTLGDVAAREHFLSVAAGYTTADLLRFEGLLSEDGQGIAPADLHRAIQLDLLDVLNEPVEETRGTRDVRDLADRVMKERSERRDARARRAEQAARRREHELDEQLAAESEAARATERVKGEARLAEQRERLEREADERAAAEAAEAKRQEQEAADERLGAKDSELEKMRARRALEHRVVLAVVLLLIPAGLLAWRWTSWDGDLRLLGVSGLVIIGGELALYVAGRLKSIWIVLGSLLVAAAGVGLELAVSNIWGG